MARTKQSARKSTGGLFYPNRGKLEAVRKQHEAHKAQKSPQKTSGASLRKAKLPQRRGAKALHEIRRFQSSVELLIKRAPFNRVCRDICNKLYMDGQIGINAAELRFQAIALEALQEAAESYLTYYMEDANLAALHAGRVTLMPKDMHLIKRLRGPNP